MKAAKKLNAALLTGVLLGTAGLGCTPGRGAVRDDADTGAREAGASSELRVTPSEPFRQTKPEPLDLEVSFEAPVPEEVTLKNGLRLLVHENRQLPLVAIHLAVLTGEDAVPVEKAGLSELVAGMLDEGTKARSAQEIARVMEDLAANFSASTGATATHLHLNLLSETLEPGVALLAELVTQPAFRKDDFERVRQLVLSSLQQKQGNPAALAADALSARLYGEDHPWGQPSGGTQATVTSITTEDLTRFHKRYFAPNNAVVVVSGDVSPQEARELFERHLGKWKRAKVSEPKLPEPRETKQHVALIDMPGSSQSRVLLGGHLFAADHPDALPLQVANYVLGGLFTSRLNLNLREDKGYSYGVRSGVSLGRESGSMVASGNIVAEHTAAALVEMQKELTRFATGDVTEEEFNRAKVAFGGKLPSQLETNDAISQAIAGLVIDGLPLDHFRQLDTRLKELTLEDLRRVAREHVTPEAWPIVVAGPVDLFQEDVAALDFGPVERVQPSMPAASGGAAAGKGTQVGQR